MNQDRPRQFQSGWIANLALSLVALVALFGVLEVGVRLFVDVRDFAPIGIQDVDPELPIRFIPHHERVYETTEFRYTVRFNAYGRRDVEWPPETIADPRSVLFIGDSFVLGNGVEHEDTIPSRIEQALAGSDRPREVLNFGMPGGDPKTYLALMENALDSGFAAHTFVVGVFVGNDFYAEVLDSDPFARRPPPPPPQTSTAFRSQLLHFLKLRLSTSATVVGWVLSLGPRLGFNVYDSAGSYIFLRHPTEEQTATFDAILEFFGRMQQLASERDREFRLVIFPNRIQVENREALTSFVFDAERPDDGILEYCRERGITCLDLLPVLADRYETRREPLYFPIDRHLNERGTQVASEAIVVFLQETGALR